MVNKKRVAALYRVSTKMQGDGEDIPMQKKACRAFIERQGGWELVKEYTEFGVSGYKVSATKRDEIKKVREDAINGLFDVLLVFMFDRLGRKDDETPFIVEWFDTRGIEVWSVKEGQQKFENHVDRLTNYIRFWQSSGESRKTSIRVDEMHSQMVAEGIYRGGTVPFGYTTVKSGRENNKGKELLKVIINNEQAEVVRKIYSFVVEEGYGQNRIAQYLNENNYQSKTGKKWTSASVNNVLKNPLYKGYYVYAKGSEKEVISPKKPDLVIIKEEVWEKVQRIRKQRSPENVKNKGENPIITRTKGALLLVGLIRCGHCGSPLCTTYNKKKYVRKDGTEKVWREAKYRCSGKAQKKVKCEGQTIYGAKKIEGVVLEEIHTYLSNLESVDLTKKIEEIRRDNLKEELKVIKRLKLMKGNIEKELKVLNDEISKSLLGKSKFKPERLNSAIDSKERELSELDEALYKAQNELTVKEAELNELVEYKKYIPVWGEVFEGATIEKKKMMLSTIIDKVVVCRDRVDISFKINLTQFLGEELGEMR